MNVVWSRRGSRQYSEATIHYESARTGLGVHFHATVQAVLNIVAQFPRAYPRSRAPHDGEVRQAAAMPRPRPPKAPPLPPKGSPLDKPLTVYPELSADEAIRKVSRAPWAVKPKGR